MSRTAPRTARSRRGLALIVVLWVLVILSIVCISFAHLARVEAQLADNFYQRSRALYMAEAGVQRLLVELENDTSGYTWSGQLWGAIDSEDEALPFEEERYELDTSDECGKLNINTATEEMLLLLPVMTEEIAQSILDWRDADDQPREQGAETEYYRAQAPSYDCPNRPFITIEELLLVRGVTPDLLYGVQQPGVEEQQPGLVELLTVYSAALDEDEMGQPRLNINTASREQLEERLSDVLAEGDAEAIVRFRDGRGNFETPAHVWDVPEIDREKMKKLLGRITTRGTPEETEREGPTEGEEGEEGQQPPEIPIPPGGGGGGQMPGPGFSPGGVGSRQAPGTPQMPGGGMPTPGGEMPGLPEGLMPTEEGEEEEPAEREAAPESEEAELLRGVINPNTATAEVLMCVPRMTEQVAQAITTRAQSQPFETLGGILEVEEIDETLLKAIIPHLTTRSRAFRTVARGTLEQRLVVAEITAVVDLTQEDPRIVYYKRGDTTATEYRPVRADTESY